MKQNSKILLEAIVDGEFLKTLDDIKTIQPKLSTNLAINCFIACCNACHMNMANPERVSEQDLLQLLNYLIKHIQNPSEVQLEHYCQSVFYIVKLFQQKKCYEILTGMQHIFIPEFISNIRNKPSIVYHNICKFLYNIVAKATNESAKTHNFCMIKICYLVSSMYHVLRKQSDLLQNAFKCSSGLGILQVDVMAIYDYYIFVLTLLEKTSEEVDYKVLLELFCLNYKNLLNIPNLEKVNECFEKTMQKMSTIFEKNTELQAHLDIIKVFQFMHLDKGNCFTLLTMCYQNLKCTLKQFRITSNFTVTCKFISNIFLAITQYFKLNRDKCLEIGTENQLKLFQFVFKVSQILTTLTHKCSCGCTIKTNFDEALKLINFIARLAKITFSNTENLSEEFKSHIYTYFEKYSTYVQQLKESDCKKWTSFWYDIGVHWYNFGMQLSRKDDVKAYLFFKKFINNTIEFEGFESKIISSTYLQNAINLLSEINLKMEDYEKSLVLIAFNIAALSLNNDSDFLRWIRIKVTCRESKADLSTKIQESTIVSILEKNKSVIDEICPNFQLTNDQKITLLIDELNSYKNKWTSKVPMMSAYKHLCEIADSFTLAKTFTKIWGDCNLYVHDNIPSLLKTTLDKYELEIRNDKHSEKRIYLSNLYYLYHKYCIKYAIIKHSEDVDKTINLEPLNPSSVPTDPNDECDIVSSYDCLRIDKYVKMLRNLDKSLQIVARIIRNNFSLKCLDTFDPNDLYKLITQIAHEYRLHCHLVKSLQSWELAYMIAKLLSNDSLILQSISFIIEFSDVQKYFVDKLIKEAEELFNNVNNNEILIQYYMCKAICYFNYDQNIAQKAFYKALDLFKNLTETEVNLVLKARLYLLHHKFIMLPCKFRIVGHEEYSIVKIHLALQIIISQYSKNSGNDSSEDISLLFEITEAIAKMYLLLRMPREVRCYCKEIVIIAQKLVLPLRTASLLDYLALADIATCSLNDCRVKIDGLTDILCLSSRSLTPNKSTELDSQKGDFEDIIDNLNCEFNEMMLDIPKKNYRQISSGSPPLLEEGFKLPSFLNHKKDCNCFYCCCVEYQKFVLKKFFLDALLNVYENNFGFAMDFFCGSLKLFEFLKSKQELYNEKLITLLTPDLIPNIEENLMETYCYISLEFANNLMRVNNKTEAKNVNKILIGKLSINKIRFIYLYNEALVQKLNILYEKPLNQLKPPENRLHVPAENNAISPKTPTSKQNKISVSINVSPIFETVKRVFKAPKFNLSENQENSIKTPKIKNSQKSKSEFLTPITPSLVQTPVDNNLKTRTKLLTERVKKSNKKTFIDLTKNDKSSESSKKTETSTIFVDLTKDDNSNKVSGRVTRSAFRKNLLSDLENENNMVKHGAIRKRNKKT